MKKDINILAESTVPYLRGVLERLGKVTYLPSAEFTPETVRDKNWLIVRSITKCTQKLLEGSRVKLITTATIGFDHIDTYYCAANGITWKNAPGCNAHAVAQWFGSALAYLEREEGYTFRGKTIGIVGVGHVGSLVKEVAEAWGMTVLQNDPPRAESEGPEGFVSLEEVYAECDVITFHTPFTKEGPHPTYHLFSEESLSKLGKRPLLVNACRGGVTCNDAILKGLESGQLAGAVIDCWENEPNISRELLEKVLLGTPHIAGFSADGKRNGAVACLVNGCNYFGIDTAILGKIEPPLPEDPAIRISPNDAHPEATAMLHTFDIKVIDETLRSGKVPFEEMRKDHPYPREPHAFTVYLPKALQAHRPSLERLGFCCELVG